MHPLFSLEVAPFIPGCGSPPTGSEAEPQPKSILAHLALTSGGNNFKDFPDNQLPKFREVIYTDTHFDIKR